MQANNVSAMVKHFAAYGSPEQGLNVGPTHGGERELRTTYLPSYKRQIVDAGAYAIMSSYHAYDGVPLIASHHVLTEILREEWGYKYFVTSDAGATDRLCNAFKMCREKPIDKEAVTLYVGYLPRPDAMNEVTDETGITSWQRRRDGRWVLQLRDHSATRRVW